LSSLFQLLITIVDLGEAVKMHTTRMFYVDASWFISCF